MPPGTPTHHAASGPDSGARVNPTRAQNAVGERCGQTFPAHRVASAPVQASRGGRAGPARRIAAQTRFKAPVRSAIEGAANKEGGMGNVVVVGAQWGDEGKGKIVDWL